MKGLEAGDAVTCGICKKDTKVSFVTDREGGTGYDLECLHRNAYCDECGTLVRDDSDTIQKVVKACPVCNPEFYSDDEDDE